MKTVSVCIAIMEQKDRVTKISVDITPERIKYLKKRVVNALATITFNQYINGVKYKHLAIVVAEVEYQTVILDTNWTYNTLVDGGIRFVSSQCNTCYTKIPN